MKNVLKLGALAALVAVVLLFPFIQGGPATAADPASPTASLLFVGDLMLGRYVGEYERANNFDGPFEQVRPFISAADLAIGNMEGPLVPSGKFPLPEPGPSVADLSTDSSAAGALQRAGFDLLSLANNHTLDRGQDGLAATADAMKQAGIDPIGRQQGEHQQPVVRQVKGLKIGFLAYTNIENAKGTGIGYVPAGDTAARDAMAADIKSARQQVDVLVVVMHWGTEYALMPDDGQRDLAQLAAGAGADLVVGSHPHVAQGAQLLGAAGRPSFVAYSLGNALFDQMSRLETRQGLALECQVDSRGVKSARLIPLQIDGGNGGYVVRVVDDATGQPAIERVAKSTPAELQWHTTWDVKQGEPGVAIAYSRPETSPGRSSVENLGMQAPTKVDLQDGRLTVSEQTGQGAWSKIWSTGDGWRVTGYTVGDATGEGQPLLVYTVWKKRLLWERPASGGMRVEMDAGEVRPHIYIDGWQRGHFTPVWHGSPRPTPPLAVAVAPIGDSKKPLLAVLESSDKDREQAPGNITIWEWTGSFGFELAAPVPGKYSRMWADGRALLYR